MDMGVALRPFWSDPACGVEIQRAAAKLSSGLWVADEPTAATVATLGGIPSWYVDRRAAGERGFYRIRHTRTGFDPSPWTPWLHAVAASVPYLGTPDSLAARLPTVTVGVSETATHGWLHLDVSDPQGRVTTVELQPRVGRDAPAAWGPAASVTPQAGGVVRHSLSVALSDKAASAIAYRMLGYDEGGQRRVLAEGSMAYSPGAVAHASVALDVDGKGAVRAYVQGDSDCVSSRAAMRTDRYPTVSEVAATASVAGRTAEHTFPTPLGPGQRAWVTVVPYNAGGAAGVPVQVQSGVSREAIPLAIRAAVDPALTTREAVAVRVAVSDPYPQGAGSVTVAASGAGIGAGGVTPSGAQTLTPTASLDTTGTVVFMVPRPQSGMGRVTLTATAANRAPAVDAVDVPALDFVAPARIRNLTANYDPNYYWTWDQGNPHSTPPPDTQPSDKGVVAVTFYVDVPSLSTREYEVLGPGNLTSSGWSQPVVTAELMPINGGVAQPVDLGGAWFIEGSALRFSRRGYLRALPANAGFLWITVRLDYQGSASNVSSVVERRLVGLINTGL